MKKPSLRFRQVFEHPTHFKVTKPLGNPLVIAKKGLSPSLMGRLRKYAEGTPDEPVQPPTEQDKQALADLTQELAQLQPPSVPAVSKPSPDLEIPEPAPVVQTVAAPVVAPAAVPAPAAPVVVVQSSPAATAPATTVQTVPVAEKPSAAVEPAPAPLSIEELARKRQEEFTAAKQEAIDAQKVAQDELFVAERDVQATREEEARREYMRRMGALAGATRAEQEAQAEKPMGASDVLRAIGSAVSVAMGAFATGMTGMPNFALQIYNAGLEESLKRARENRQSAYNKAIAAGVDARDAEKYWRAQQDKTMALALQEKANAVQNADAKAKMLDAAQQFYAKSVMDEADVRKKLAEASKAEAEAKSEPLKTQNAALEIQRKAYNDYVDALNKANQIKVTDEASRRAYNAAIYNANKDYEAAMAGIKAKEKPEGGAAEMGAPIPGFLKGAKDEEIRKHRVEFEIPERDEKGDIVDKRQVGFLVDPRTRKDFLALSSGFSTAKRQAEEIRDWAKANPTGLAGIALSRGISAANQEREKIEPLVKTMVEGYIKNVTGIRRASSAAIKYMQEVVKNPAEMKNLVNTYLGGSTSRFNEIIKEIEAGERDLKNRYIAGGVQQSPELEPDRGVPQRRAGQ